MKHADSQKVEKALEEFNPQENKVDRRILFEITGLRLHNDELVDSDPDSGDDQPRNDPYRSNLVDPEAALLSVNT